MPSKWLDGLQVQIFIFSVWPGEDRRFDNEDQRVLNLSGIELAMIQTSPAVSSPAAFVNKRNSRNTVSAVGQKTWTRFWAGLKPGLKVWGPKHIFWRARFLFLLYVWNTLFWAQQTLGCTAHERTPRGYGSDFEAFAKFLHHPGWI